tara:strand:+ start:69 stop:683 length:615 start_codon:yes stop_codon:yes gene_type:complete
MLMSSISTNKRMVFDGVNNKVDSGVALGANADLTIGGTIIATATANNNLITGDFDGSTNRRAFFVSVEGGTGKLSVITNGVGAGGGNRFYTFDAVMADGTEHSFEVVYLNGGTLTATVDGVTVTGSGSIATSLYNSGNSISVGSSVSGPGVGGHYTGLLYNILIKVNGTATRYRGYGNQDGDWLDTTGGGKNGVVNGSPEVTYI